MLIRFSCLMLALTAFVPGAFATFTQGRPDRRLSVPSSLNPGRGGFPRPFSGLRCKNIFIPRRGLHLGVRGLEPHHILRHFSKLLIPHDSLDSFCSASS